MNKVFFCGRTTRDIELRYSSGENQTAVAKFSLAVYSGFGDNKRTDFFNLTAFGKQAETLEKYVPKGTKILVECEAKQEQYTNKEGQRVNTVSFIVRSFEFCESKKLGEPVQTTGDSYSDEGFMPVSGDTQEQLPFA